MFANNSKNWNSGNKIPVFVVEIQPGVDTLIPNICILKTLVSECQARLQ
jgi:hypothetical protein